MRLCLLSVSGPAFCWSLKSRGQQEQIWSDCVWSSESLLTVFNGSAALCLLSVLLIKAFVSSLRYECFKQENSSSLFPITILFIFSASVTAVSLHSHYVVAVSFGPLWHVTLLTMCVYSAGVLAVEGASLSPGKGVCVCLDKLVICHWQVDQ